MEKKRLKLSSKEEFKEIILAVEKELETKFDDPYFSLTEINSDYAVFNYSNFWDSYSECTEGIEKERAFLIKKCSELKGRLINYIYIADDVLKLH